MKIAIQGHPVRGKEVIKILESLGGKNGFDQSGSNEKFVYYINSIGLINSVPQSMCSNERRIYTLEEFEEEFPFKIGDRVISTTTNFIGTITNFKESGYCYVKLDSGNFLCIFKQHLKLYKEMNEGRNITLTLEKAKEWYTKGGELKEIALQAFTEKELNPLPRSWKEFCENYPIKPGEIYVDGYSKFIVNNLGTRNHIHDKNICPSQKSAEAHLAMIQLEQLRNCWWNGWEPEWNNCEKYVIKWEKDNLIVFTAKCVHAFLVFPTREMAEEFLECFRNLIEKAGDLI